MATEVGVEARSFDAPDEVRPFTDGKGRVEIVRIAGVEVGRGTFEPGWRWSVNVKPMAGTDSCMFEHTGYLISGRMCVRMDDGTELELAAGDAIHIMPGHDAWTVGDEPCVMIDVGGVDDYAKPTTG